MRLGIGSYTYVWAAGVPGYPAPSDPLTPFGLLERAAKLGVRVVQIADNMPLHVHPEGELADLVRKARRQNVQIEVGTRGIQRDHLLEYLEHARRFRSPIVRTLIDDESRQERHLRHPSAEAAVEALAAVAADFERAGVHLAIENHDRFKAAALLEMIEQTGSDFVAVCFDTANSIGCIEGPEAVLQVLGTRIVNLHIKDFQVFRPPHNKGFVVEGRPAGQGMLDLPRLLAQIGRYSARASAILELWPPPQRTLDESIALEDRWADESIHYLRQLIPD